MKKLFLSVFALLSVQLSHAQWEEDFRLTQTYDTSFINNYGSDHCIAAIGDTIHVVWYEKIDDNWEIFYKRSTDGGNNWEADTRLTNTQSFSQYPSVSVSGSSVYVVWTENIDGNWDIYFIRSTNGGSTWDDMVRLTEDPQRSYASTCASSGDDVHVAWTRNDVDEQTWKVYYRHSADGGLSWSNQTWLSTNSPDAYNISLAATGYDIYAVWNDSRDGTLEIYFCKSSDNGLTWGPETRLTYDPAYSQFPSVAASGSSVYVSWQDSRTELWDIYYKGSTDGGETWSNDIPVTDDGACYNPNLASSDSVLHLVYQDAYNGNSEIYYNSSIDGGNTWSSSMQLNNLSFSSQRPFIAVSGPALHVIWYDYRDFNYEIYYKRNPTGGMVGLDEQLRAESIGLSVYPNPACQQLTVDSWQLTDGQSAVGGRRSAVKLSIVDLFGREFMEYEEVTSFPYQVDISGLPDGVYILKMTDGSGIESAVKFVKTDDSL